MTETRRSLSNRLTVDTDRLLMTSRDQVAFDAHAMVAPLDSEPGDRHVAAIAVLFYLATRRYAGSPHGLYELGRRLFEADGQDDAAFHTKARSQFEALDDFFVARIATQRQH